MLDLLFLDGVTYVRGLTGTVGGADEPALQCAANHNQARRNRVHDGTEAGHMLKQLKADNAEGIVFKQIFATLPTWPTKQRRQPS